MKRLLTWFFLIASAHASTSVLTSTIVTDPDGQTWNSGTFSARLNSPNGGPTINGVPVALTFVSGTMTASGQIVATVTDTASLDQSGATWCFTLQPNASVASTQICTAVTGGTPNLSTTLSAVKAPRFNPGTSSYGYLDAEVLTPQIGSIYFNVTSDCIKNFSFAGWSTCSGGSGPTTTATLPAGFPQQIQGFYSPITNFSKDGQSWDATGIGGPSNTIFVKNEYWVAVAGYPNAGFTSQAIGLWHGPDLSHMTAYSGNPIITNTGTAWNAACIEGPDLNIDTAGNIYISFLGFSASCDGFGTGQIGIVSTSADSFPTGWSAIPATPTIPMSANLHWLYRPFIIEIGGICYDYSNAGNTSDVPLIVSFHTTGTCLATETTAAAWTTTATTVFGITQGWEGSTEIQDPQVWQDPSGLYIMVYGGAGTYKMGYATTLTPAANNWVKNASNPANVPISAGTSVGNGPWIPRLTEDSSGQYWMMGNYNNTTGMSFYKAAGPTAVQVPAVPTVNVVGSTADGTDQGAFQNTNINSFTGFQFNNSAGVGAGFFLYGNTGETGLSFLINKVGVGANAGGITGDALCLFGSLTPGNCGLLIDGNNSLIGVLTTPSSSGATCTAGTIAWDAGFIYICTATNTWKRAALITF